MKLHRVICSTLILALAFTTAATADGIAINDSQISWQAAAGYGDSVLTISGPDGYYERYSFAAGQAPTFSLFDADGYALADGSYNWEIIAAPRLSSAQRKELGDLRASGRKSQLPPGTQTSGHFRVFGGAFVRTDASEEGGKPQAPAWPTQVDETPAAKAAAPAKDNVILDDQIVEGSACVGLDCANGENFGFDTFRLKENNLRIHFDDTSTTASFPGNDWRIIANDSGNGGANKFSIEDSTAGRIPFTLEAGAPANSLYVDDAGNIATGTSNPVVELHIADGDSPTVRLEQNGSSGFQSQTWDIAGNETNFFVRDVTNGSLLPFKIFPQAPTNALTVEGSTGDIGVGIQSAGAALHVRRSNGTAKVLVQDTDTTAASRTLFDLQNNGTTVLRFQDTRDANGWQIRSASSNSDFEITREGSGNTELMLDSSGNLTIHGTLTANNGMSNFPDYVFDPSYELMPLDELEAFIQNEKHLPNIPSAEEVRKNGLNMTEMQRLLVEKVEELTLYTLAQEKAMQKQEQLIEQLSARLAAVEGGSEIQ